MLSVVFFRWSPLPDQAHSIPSQMVTGSLASPYEAEHVNRLAEQIARNCTLPLRFVLVTDDATGIDPHIRIVPLWDKCRDLGGCYNRLYVFSKEMRKLIGPRFACIDLDTVVLGNIDHILGRRESFVYYRWESEREAARFNCGLFMMNAGARSYVWDEFAADPAAAIHASRFHCGTDQAWCNHRLPLDREASFGRDDGILDFRVDILQARLREPPDDCCMVTFAGPRNPNDAALRTAYPWLV